MLLYFTRHGIAEDAKPGQPDSQRELTDEGRSRLADVYKRLTKASVKPSLILTSPYKRALQTAELAAKAMGCAVAPLTSERLVPHASPRDVWDEIRDHRESDTVMLVGHEPLFSQSISYLLNTPTLQVDVKKGSVTAIEMQSFRGEPRGVLKWMLTPKLCG
jgi:phosphohistidine phosphatase